MWSPFRRRWTYSALMQDAYQKGNCTFTHLIPVLNTVHCCSVKRVQEINLLKHMPEEDVDSTAWKFSYFHQTYGRALPSFSPLRISDCQPMSHIILSSSWLYLIFPMHHSHFTSVSEGDCQIIAWLFNWHFDDYRKSINMVQGSVYYTSSGVIL
jgi:hypothetical protein